MSPEFISRPIACEFCGYNLKGLSTDHRCPECGADASTVLSQPPIHKRPRKTRVLIGARLLILGMALVFCSFSGCWLVISQYPLMDGGGLLFIPSPTTAGSVVLLTAALLELGGLVMMCKGAIWLLGSLFKSPSADHHTTPEFEPANADIGMRITGAITCVGCGQKLGGVDVDGECPTCSRSVADSIKRDNSPRATDARREAIKRGLELLHNSGRLIAVACAIGFVLTLLTWLQWSPIGIGWWLRTVVNAAFVTGVIIAARGVSQVTNTDGSSDNAVDDPSLGTKSKSSAAIFAMIAVAQFAITLIAPSLDTDWRTHSMILGILQTLSAATACVAVLTFAEYLATLGLCRPDPETAASGIRVSRWFALSVIVAWITQIAPPILVTFNLASLWTYVFFAGALFTLTALMTGARLVSIVGRFRRAVADVHTQSQTA